MFAHNRSTESPGSDSPISTLVDMLRWRAQREPDKRGFTFLTDGERDEYHLSFGQLDHRARAVAVRLQQTNLVGQRVLLLMPPGPDYLVAFFGCLYAPAVAVPVYPPPSFRNHRSSKRIMDIVASAQAQALITTESIASRVAPSMEHEPRMQPVHWLTVEQIDFSPVDAWQTPPIAPDGVAYLQYTSGVTGSPKGVMITHRNALHNLALIHEAFELSPQTRAVSWLPPYHDMGLIGGLLEPLYAGILSVLLSPWHFIQQPIRWLNAISSYRATISGGPNFAYEYVLRKTTPEQRRRLDLSGWELAFNGAEPIRASTLKRFSDALAPCGFRPHAFYPCYGLAEATLLVAGPQKGSGYQTRNAGPDRLPPHRTVVRSTHDGPPQPRQQTLISCGSPRDGKNVIVVSPRTGTCCEPGRMGEVWVRGDSVAKGYWNLREETAETFENYLTDTGEGPFLRTGDLGFIEDGQLYVAGRLKEMLIIRGRNHYPQDIEHTAQQCHEALEPDCGAAFEVDVDGEHRLVLVQAVSRAHLPDLDVRRVKEDIVEALSSQHGLRAHAIVLVRPSAIPKTSSGKIQRSACRDQFLTGSMEELALASGPGEKKRTSVSIPP